MYPVCRSAVGFYRALSEQGYDLIVDELLFDPHRIGPYFDILIDQKVYFMAIKPAKVIVIQPEKARGDRLPGLAAGPYDEVYDPLFSFDLVVDGATVSFSGGTAGRLNSTCDYFAGGFLSKNGC